MHRNLMDRSMFVTSLSRSKVGQADSNGASQRGHNAAHSHSLSPSGFRSTSRVARLRKALHSTQR
jgi:hypothetical protein